MNVTEFEMLGDDLFIFWMLVNFLSSVASLFSLFQSSVHITSFRKYWKTQQIKRKLLLFLKKKTIKIKYTLLVLQECGGGIA